MAFRQVSDRAAMRQRLCAGGRAERGTALVGVSEVSPRNVAQFAATSLPLTSPRCCFSGLLRCASCALPAPVGLVSKIGSRARIETCSSYSIVLLKAQLSVA